MCLSLVSAPPLILARLAVRTTPSKKFRNQLPSMKSFQELPDEAFRNLLRKQGRPTGLKSALRESAKGSGKRRPRATRYI
jgi:hypothetical protein